MSAVNVVPQRWTFQYEHAGVVGSNDLFYVHYNPGASAQSLGTDVFPVTVAAKPITSIFGGGTYGPTPAPLPNYNGASGSLTFISPSAPAQSFTTQEFQYHDAFSLNGGCVSGGQTIVSVGPSSAFPNPNPLTPPGQNSGPATFTATPALAGVCSQSVKDVYGQNIAESIQVMGALAVSPTSMTLGLAGAGQVYPTAAGGSTTKTYDQYPIALSFSGCATVVSVAPGAASYPGSPGTTPSTTPFTVTALAPGSCALTVADQYGEAGTIGINVAWPPLNPGTPSYSNLTSTTVTLNSTPPTGGSGSGYYVDWVFSDYTTQAGCGNVSYACVNPPNPGVVPGLGPYIYCAIYGDGGGDRVNGGCVTFTVPGIAPGCPLGETGTPPNCVTTPPPPPPCTLDSYGYCWTSTKTSTVRTLHGLCEGESVGAVGTITVTYTVYNAGGLVGTYIYKEQFGCDLTGTGDGYDMLYGWGQDMTGTGDPLYDPSTFDPNIVGPNG